MKERQNLVQTLKQEGTLTDPAVEAAFLTTPCHLFLDAFYLREQTAPPRWKLIEPSGLDPLVWCTLVYANEPRITQLNEIGNPTSSSSSPTIMAQALEIATLANGQHVLEIGTGTGYNAALLSHIVGDLALVTTVELESDLAHIAQQRLDRVVGPGVHARAADGLQGYLPDAPYDRILATASTQRIPLAWLDQLRDGGLIVMHLQGHLTGGCLLRFQKQGAGRSSSGQMITGSDFMELRNPSAPPPLAPQLLAQLLREPITAEVSLTSTLFDPTLLWNHDLAFLLQELFPAMYLTKLRKPGQEPQVCLLDARTQTLLGFRSVEKDRWDLEVRGSTHLWEQVRAISQQWFALGKPAATAYELLIDAQGKQTLTLTSPSQRQAPSTWVIYEPE